MGGRQLLLVVVSFLLRSGDELLELSLTDGFGGKYCLFVFVESLFCLRNEGQGLMRQLISASMAISHQESCELTAAQQGFQVLKQLF